MPVCFQHDNRRSKARCAVTARIPRPLRDLVGRDAAVRYRGESEPKSKNLLNHNEEGPLLHEEHELPGGAQVPFLRHVIQQIRSIEPDGASTFACLDQHCPLSHDIPER